MKKEIIKETEQGVEEKSKNHSNQLFRRAAFITLGVVGVIFMVALIVGRNLFKAVQVDTEYIAYTPKASSHTPDMVKKEGKKPKVKSKTIMVFGVDKGEGRTDTILIAHLDSNTEKVSVVSVPRDTRVYWSEEQRDKADRKSVV